MTTIFSQKVNVDGKEQIYECSITDNDTVLFTHEINSFEIDFPTLREFIKINGKDYNNDHFSIKDGFDVFRFFSKTENEKIILPKSYFLESYQILEKIWEDDK